jgi:PAS domain S-box-containing protein
MIRMTIKNQLRRYFDRRNRPAWAVLAFCLCIMLLVWYSTQASKQQNAQTQFKLHVREITQAIQNRLRDHEQILLGGAGLFDASHSVERNEWHDFLQRLNLSKNYPGILGVGYSQIVKPDDLAAHEVAVRAEGFPGFKIKPEGKRSLYSSIVYLEPFTGRNLAAFGYDMLSEPTRAKAMTLAAETGNTTISGKVKLVQETHGKVQAGFLMYVPIYRKHLPLRTIKDRWYALQGFVYSPYRIGDLMQAILGERVPMIDFMIYDGAQERDDGLMYSSQDELAHATTPAKFTTVKTIKAYGHAWTIRFQSRPIFENQFHSLAGRTALVLGGSSSLLLFTLVSFLIFRRERAEEMATAMTAEIRLNEEKLRLSEERFELAVFATNDGIWDWDIVANTYYYSPRFMKLLDLSTAESSPAVDVFAKRLHPEDQFAACHALRVYLSVHESFSVTCRMQTSEGEWHWFRNCGIAVRGPDGSPVRIVGSILDITEAKVTERTLQETHAHTQTILDNVVDAIITIDTSGAIQTVNRAGEVIFGYRAEELIGNNINLLMPEPYHGQYDTYLQNHLETPVANIIGSGHEVAGLRKDGTSFAMDINISTIERQQNPLFICVLRDITERKKVEKMKSEFVSTVSHELRTPLTSIKGALSLILSKSADELSAKTLTMLKTASRNSERLSILINDILDLEKIENGNVEFEFKPIDLVNVARQAVEANQGYAQQHGVRLKLHVAVDSAPILGDENRLQQVFANLLSNAIKFSHSGSHVDIRVEAHAQGYRSSVEDYGRGIPQEFGSRIFQRFAQADSSDTRLKGGTGLGLSITKAIIGCHQGRIDYHSQEDAGTLFYFDLPALAPANSNRHAIQQ